MIDTAELDDRILKCEKILATDANSQIFAALAEAYRKKGDLRKAEEICLNGLKIHPGYASARIVMAKIYMAKEDYERAWDELKLGVESSGRTRAIDVLESEILIRTGRANEAKAILKRLYLSDPGDETIKSLMSLAGELDSSIEASEIDKPEGDHSRSGGSKLSLQRVVNIIKVTPRVLGVVAVNDQGLAIDGRFDGNIPNEEMAALSKGIFDICHVGNNRISLGETREILIETQSTKLWLIKAPMFILVVLTRDDVSLGSLKMKIEELLQRVEYKGNSTEQGEVY